MQPQSTVPVCAQNVYVRNRPAGVVLGTLVRGDNFDHQRSDASNEWWYGRAYGDVHQDGWVLSSAFHGC